MCGGAGWSINCWGSRSTGLEWQPQVGAAEGETPATGDRLDWLASHLDRPGYYAEAGGPPGDILALVAWRIDRELREVFDLVRSRLDKIAAEEDDEDSDD
jgi:hypothetical protein